MKKRKLKKSVIAKFIIFLCLIGGLFSLLNIIRWTKNVKENANIKEKLNESIEIVENDIIDVDDEVKIPKYRINFEYLKTQNSDVIAYLKVNGTNIDYIVVKGTDNDYYLNHNFDKNKNIAGWIYADYHNKFDESDKNLIIYGHNTKDGSMFGTLKDILKEEWYKNTDNRTIILITENGTYYYEVFSTYDIIPEDYYINTEFNNEDEFEEFVKTLKNRSVYDYGVDVGWNDNILTLSSCMNAGKKRVVLHAKLIKDGKLD